MFCGEFRLKIALPCQWLSQLEIFGGLKCLTLGKQTYFLGHPLSKHKLLDVLKLFFGGMAPRSPWLRLCNRQFVGAV